MCELCNRRQGSLLSHLRQLPELQQHDLGKTTKIPSCSLPGEQGGAESTLALEQGKISNMEGRFLLQKTGQLASSPAQSTHTAQTTEGGVSRRI